MINLNVDPTQFAKTGYCLFPNVFSHVEVESNRRLLDEATDNNVLDGENYLGEPHTKDDRWMTICRNPRLLDAIESILGPNLILVYSSVFIKPPNSVDFVPWHQDNTYWKAVHGTDVVTVWLAIDDADTLNSAMKIIPGSHTGHREMETTPSAENAMVSKTIEITSEMEDTAVTLEMKAGSVSIHDSFILHGSDANLSDRRRAGYTIRYCSTDTAWVDVDLHPVPVYLVRGQAGSRGDGYTDCRP